MIRPRRSVLFTPGSNARAMEKARSLTCDVIVLDLEDAVAPEDKDKARAAVCEAVAARVFGGKEVVVRLNGFDSPWRHDDLEAVAKARPDAILLPKILGAAEVAGAHRALPQAVAVWAMIESAKAILHLDAIAAAGPACLVLGSNDLIKEMRARILPGRENLWAAMSLLVAAARAHGLGAIDGTYNMIADAGGLAAECEQGRAFGFDGKTLIHPGQIDTANRIFSPSAAEIADARRILAAFAQNPGKSVLALDGRMVERLHAEEAARLVALSEAIGAR